MSHIAEITIDELALSQENTGRTVHVLIASERFDHRIGQNTQRKNDKHRNEKDECQSGENLVSIRALFSLHHLHRSDNQSLLLYSSTMAWAILLMASRLRLERFDRIEKR